MFKTGVVCPLTIRIGKTMRHIFFVERILIADLIYWIFIGLLIFANSSGVDFYVLLWNNLSIDMSLDFFV